MDNFRVFIPLSKGIKGKGSETVFEPNGQKKTKYLFRGIASTTALDKDSERVSKTCLKEMANSIKAKKLPIFGNHEHGWENMLGYSNNAEVVGDSLIIDIETEFAETNPKIEQLVGKMNAGLPLGLSIGGKVKEHHSEREPFLKKDIKVLDSVELYETSIVGIAANPEAYLSTLPVPDQIHKSLKPEKINGFEGQLSENGKEILSRVFDEAKKMGYDSERSGKIAWGACKAAGIKSINMEEIDMEKASEEFTDFLKSSGVIGINSYGKLGETTPQAKCPECGMPSELLNAEEGNTVYVCRHCGKKFTVEKNTNETSQSPESQPAKMPLRNISENQEVLGQKSARPEIIKEKGGISLEKAKKSDADTELEKPETEKAKEEDEEVPEEDYKKFLKMCKRALKEGVFKAEGMGSTPPGGENANAKYSIGGSGGAASPVHQKSQKEYELMQKAIKENVGLEGLESAPKTEEADLSFNSMRKFAKNGYKTGGN